MRGIFLDKGLKKVVYISIIIVSFVLVITLLFILALNFLSKDVYDLVILISIVFLLSIIFVYVLSLVIIASVYKVTKVNKNYARIANISLKVTRPLILMIAQVFRFDMENIRGFFISLNNTIVSSMELKYKSSEILVILPHCLQNFDCRIKVTGSIEYCKDCGKCTISEIKHICREFNVAVVIVTGGTAARNIVLKYRPKVIIAVACERDLLEGIIDVRILPILGIMNERPNGPCFNTFVNTAVLRRRLELIVEK